MKPTTILWALVALFAILLLCSLAHAAGTPPTVTVANLTVAENAGSATLVINKTKANSYSKVTVQTIDGTAKANVDYKPVSTTITLGNNTTRYSLPITLLNNSTYQGTRSFTVKLTAVRFVSVQSTPATVTITDDESAMQTCPDGSIINADAVCAPATKTCSDGIVVNADQPCPTTSPQWVAAPLRAGGFARVTAVDAWDIAGPGVGRQLQVGEIVALYVHGSGITYDNRTTYAVHALSDGGDGRAYGAKLEGVAPVGFQPALPDDWFYGILVTATATCPNMFDATKPGVTQGVQYRTAALYAGGYTIPTNPAATMAAVPADNPYLGPLTTVEARCFQ